MSNQVEIIYSSGRNSKETGEIIRISPRKSARGIRPLGARKLCSLVITMLMSILEDVGIYTGRAYENPTP